ncbi:flagellar motor switch protein FliN [Aliihoeflea aestuarii]|jgi:flagellar motor switch protein FliN|uniref:flagellar motor switch protein FliN n=1 Tax=Aliihoeflea aestuarii TaxID=453840 RepID=UPI002095598D|nr:flagellar motor switch protein FliN [Aliihoeflea aestuarii]MCO6392875.1 flagellar motor switch protein FliN [Aliihoeflea aestuarii]
MTKAQAGTPEDIEEDQLNQAIEELRGVLNESEDGEGLAATTAAAPRSAAAAAAPAGNSVIMNIPVDVQIVLGSTEMPVSELMALQKGSTVALDRRIGEPVDIVVNGRKIASGEITVLEDDPSRFGVKLTQIVDTTRQG